MNGNNGKGCDGEEANDHQRRDTVDERAAARRDRLGYDLDSVADWDTPGGAWYDAGDVKPSGLSAAAWGSGSVWEFDADTFASRSVGVRYSSTEVYLPVEGRDGQLRAGLGCELRPAVARDLGEALFDAANQGNTAAGSGVSATFTPGSTSVNGGAPGLTWDVEGDDTDTTVSVACDGSRVRLDVEAAAGKAEARLVADLTPAEAEELGAAIYQAGEDSAKLTELDSDAAAGEA